MYALTMLTFVKHALMNDKLFPVTTLLKDAFLQFKKETLSILWFMQSKPCKLLSCIDVLLFDIENMGVSPIKK